jgi:immune inhibitor A
VDHPSVVAVEGAELVTDPPPRPFDYTVVNPEPPRRVPNATRSFWVHDPATGEPRQVTARLRVQTHHAAMWIEEWVWHDVRKMEEAALLFDSLIYPTVVSAFGSEWNPGVDNDPRVQILHADLGEGVLGYTSSADELPADIYTYSNEAELIVVQAVGLDPGSPTYMALLARELQRLVHWNLDRNEDRWVKDGLAELAVALCGLDGGSVDYAFLQNPDASLAAWAGESAGQRGAGYLLALYFHDLFGDEGIWALVSQQSNGVWGFEDALAELGTGLTFEDLFADWLAATYLDHLSEGEISPYSYPDSNVAQPALAADLTDYPAAFEGSVHQLGVDYIRLQSDDDLRVRFEGTESTPLLGLSAHQGDRFWWSVPADESFSTLSRSFDLAGTTEATLTYWTWFDTEAGCDYAYVEASGDGGETWQTLLAPSASGGQARSYSGQSGGGPAWIHEEANLSPFAGGEVLVRFSYLTDGASLGTGLALDDIAIPEIGYYDGAESGDGQWDASGFFRAAAAVEQRYVVLVIGIGEEISVQRVAVGGDQMAEWVIPLASDGWDRAIIAVSGLAPITPLPAFYTLSVQQESPGS